MKKNHKIIYQDPKKLNPAAYNPRAISEYAFSGLCESLKKFGFVDPAVVNTRTGNLVSGHQRTKAAIALGMASVPVIEIDVSLAEEKALNVTMNNQSISGQYTESLESLINEIKEELDEDFLTGLALDDALVQISSDSYGWYDDLPHDSEMEPQKDETFAIKIKGDPEQTSKKELKSAIKELIRERGFEVEIS